MSFAVRIFGHMGLVAMKVVEDSGQNRSDSVYHLQNPYLWSQLLVADVTAVSSTAIVPPVAFHTADPTTVLRIEVPDGQAIRYEINPPNRNVVASNTSPKMSGNDQFQWGAGWGISIIDAAGLP